MIDAYRDAGGRGRLRLQVHLSAGPPTRRGRWRSRTTSGAATSSRRRSAGTSSRRSTSTGRPSTSPPEQVARGRCYVSADLGRHAAGCTSYVELGFDEVYLHHVGQEQGEFIDAFGAKVLPQLDVTEKPRGGDG